MLRLFRVVASFLQTALDIVLPRKERVRNVERYSLHDLVVSPKEERLFEINITTLLSYRDASTENCIRALKYDNSVHAARLLADILADYLREEIASLRSFSTQPVLLVPLPLHARRENERGYNQIHLVLTHLPLEFHDGTLASIHNDILMRVRATEQQTHLSRHERLLNVTDAFALSDVSTVLDAHVILVDDVLTTGATLSQAARPFMTLDVPVSTIALARA